MDFVQKRIEELDKEQSQLNPANADDAFRIRRIDLEKAELQEQLRNQERVEKQEAELNDIPLPHDYNKVFDDDRANDEIKGLLKQLKEQLFNEHNDELQAMREEYKVKLGQSCSAEFEAVQKAHDLKESFDRLANQVSLEIAEKVKAQDDVEALHDKLSNAVRLKEEAEAARDILAKENRSLKEQINELESMLATYKKPKLTSGILLTSTIKSETAEERKARQKREELARIDRRLAERGLEPLRVPGKPTDADIQKQLETVSQAAEDAERFQDVVSIGDTRAIETQEGATEALGNAQTTNPTLEERVAALESWKNSLEAAKTLAV
ncbi:coiled-coil domain-containing protein [Paenibacillus chitinolyticus]|uniref:hypothetical protein n=1 Tax=Paenibacillus chitinolyticus TaxID=79263 RepID=UPI0036578303